MSAVSPISINIETLQATHDECKKHLIPLVTEIRAKGQYGFKHSEILSKLESCNISWEKRKKAGGHAKFKNKVTKVVVEFQVHTKKGSKSNDLDPGAVVTIRDQVQEHLNILSNEIFCFKKKGWSEAGKWHEVDYAQALVKYKNWSTSKPEMKK